MDTSSTRNDPQHRRDRNTPVTVIAPTSWGERLLPYLFAGMETCVVDAILIGLASLSFLPNTLLVPLWSPFVFIAGVYWLTTSRARLAENAGTSLNTILVTAFLVVGVLLTLWSSMYTASFLFFDPRWLASLLGDLLLLNGNAFHTVFLLFILAFFGWRGIRLSRHDVEPGSVATMLKIGVSVLLIIIVLRGLNGSQENELAFLLLIPVFLALLLVAHALAQVILLRRSHSTGLQGSTNAQERSLLSIVALIGLILLMVSLLIGTLANPVFLAQVERLLAPVGVVYDWFAHGLAYVATILVAPLIWLIQALHLHTAQQKVRQVPPPVKTAPLKGTSGPVNDATLNVLAHIIEIALPILIVLLVVVALRVLLRRRRMRLGRRQEDLHESLWSWSLFWTQVQAFFAHLFRRFRPKNTSAEQDTMQEKLTGEPATRSIREIYRALLRWSAARGVTRKRAETPYEFRARLDARLHVAEPELSIVTEAYNATRYGLIVPDDNEVTRVREAWSRIQQAQVQQK